MTKNTAPPPANVLALDTSSNFLAVSLVSEGGAVFDVKASSVTHGKLLTSLVLFLKERMGDAFENIELVSIGVGPGSFTGVRVGVSFGIGLAIGLGIPAVGVSSLMARAFSLPMDGVVVSGVDGRREEIFFGIYEKSGNVIREVSPERRAKIWEFSSLVPSGAHVVLDGRKDFLEKMRNILGHFLTPLQLPSFGISLAALGKRKFEDSGNELPNIKAVYLRKSDPEELLT